MAYCIFISIITCHEHGDGDLEAPTGTAATADMGVAVGSKFSMPMISVSKFRNGKATEHWEFMQPADMMKMMAGAQKR